MSLKMAYCMYTITILLFLIAIMPVSSIKEGKRYVIKTFRKNGDIIDCFDIYKQPSLAHKLLKDHQVQLKPQNISKSTFADKPTNISSQISFKKSLCPDGYVPIKRTTNDDIILKKYLNYPIGQRLYDPTLDLIYYDAMAEYKFKNHGAKGILNVWGVDGITVDQSSSSAIWIFGGPIAELNIVVAGWMVKPSLFKDNKTRLFIVWNARGQRCFNIECPGFIQVSTKLYIGDDIEPLSIYEGEQYDIEISIFQDLITRDWWLAYGGENVGYWPKSLFTHLHDGGNYISWGGHVTTPSSQPKPPMGSGHKPLLKRNTGRVAYIRQMQVNHFGKFMDPEKGFCCHQTATDRGCYGVRYDVSDAFWGHNVIYGGHGGDCGY